MAKEEWVLPRGWTCEHQHAKSLGPCKACFSYSGLCGDCQKPLDDHNGLGTADFQCPQRKKQAA